MRGDAFPLRLNKGKNQDLENMLTPQGHSGLKTEKPGGDTQAPDFLPDITSSSPQLTAALRQCRSQGGSGSTCCGKKIILDLNLLMPTLISCLTLDKLHISEAQFPFPCNEGTNTYLTELLGELN